MIHTDPYSQYLEPFSFPYEQGPRRRQLWITKLDTENSLAQGVHFRRGCSDQLVYSYC